MIGEKVQQISQQPLIRLQAIGSGLAVLLLLGNCYTNKDPDFLFEYLPPNKTGIHFKNSLTEDESFNIIEYLYFYNGGGVAIGDINNDGLPDVFFTSNQGENKLYLNKGGFEFEDISEMAGISSPGPWKTGVTMADVNGDGWLDIYVCRVSGYKGLQGHNELFINNGDLTFTESAKEYGLDFQGFSTQAAFFDFDMDGDLDLYLLNHAVHTQRAYGDASLRHIDDAKAGDRLFMSKLNEGDTTFVSVTSKSGIFSSNIGYGLGVGISDLNQDGWPDIYVGNDFNENDYIYINNKDGTFKEASDEMLGHSSRFSMGNDLADINNDGWPEILALDMHPEDETTLKRSAGEDAHEIYTMKLSFGYGWQSAQNTLQLNLKDGTFSEIAQFSGIYATDWSWACLLADFDLDGLKDIYISNGIKRRPNDMDYINFITSDEVKGGLQNNPDLPDMALVEQMPAGDVSDVFYKNNGDLTFQDMSKEWGMNKPSLSNGAAYADLDGDGDLDLVVNRINEPAGIYRNLTKETRNGNHLKLRFEGMGMNTFGIGAKVLAYIGEQVLFYENFNTRGFQSAVEPGLTLGLGKKPRVDSLKVIWPSGICQTIYGVEGNRSLMLKEQEANEQNCRFPHSGAAIFEKSAPFTPFIHQEDNYNDFNLDFLLPHKLSREGPSLAMGHQGDTTYMFFTGAAGQKGELWMHAPHSGPTLLPVPELEVDKSYEDVHAVFFDSNNNGLPDLYVVAGGNLSSSHGLALDRLYINLGNGKFRRSNTHLPKIVSQGAKVVAADWNGDGWQDLFIAARNEVGAYGQSPKSTLLLNRGDGTFRDATTEVGLMDGLLGMLTDALPIDLDKDGKMDLVLCGEWSPVRVFINQGDAFEEKTAEFGLDNTRGWWKTLFSADINGNGWPDLIAGNQGTNSKLKSPAHLFISDWDKNGKEDPILAYERCGKLFPLANRDELIRQVPFLKKKFGTHQSFAGKSMDQIFGKKSLEHAGHQYTDTFESSIFLNLGGKSLQRKPLPKEVQFSPVLTILGHEVGKGKVNFIVGGNFLHASPYFGPYDAGRLWYLEGNGNGDFDVLYPFRTGLNGSEEVRDLQWIAVDGENYLVATQNDGEVIYFKWKKNK